MSTRAGAHMRETDAFAWYMERDPALRSTIVAVAFFDPLREAPDLGLMPELPAPERHGAADLVADAVATTLERAAGFVRHELTGIPGSAVHAVPDPDVLVECLREGFAEVTETADEAVWAAGAGFNGSPSPASMATRSRELP